MIDSEIFTEQAEYLSGALFRKWSISHQNESEIIRKLTQAGAKLITGPRGCGKTTLMLKAYNRLLKGSGSTGFPVYVNFKSSLKLEPLYKNNTNAAYWFNQWVLMKILLGIYETLDELSNDSVLFRLNVLLIKKNIELRALIWSRSGIRFQEYRYSRLWSSFRNGFDKFPWSQMVSNPERFLY
jgi:predicted AAA+ superfamily ATPase